MQKIIKYLIFLTSGCIFSMVALICFVFFHLNTGKEGTGKLNLLQIYLSVKKKEKMLQRKMNPVIPPHL